MPKITIIEHNGTEHHLDADVGQSVMQVATNNLIQGIIGDCGGNCACATCHGYVDDAWMSKVPPVGDDERCMLEGALHTTGNSRLTCQLHVTPELDGLVIRLPESQM